ncbi:MAG: undecaprenyldiphospho-muramoylpentapeptide beta-N-acetylglucosaminyltransferase [Syntrophus sp. (in: bacteria)]|nr:undecaprenyldiphospho-muramoylpentapeptide beta-N-acetylglucosaminyltransferase [Syntrophus sp. (in: bacteria)]
MGLNTDNQCIAEPQPEDGAGKNRSRSPHGCGLGMIIAGGGTGGHLFPGIAIAEEFLSRSPSHRILFIGAERGLEKKILGGLGLPLRTIRVEGIKGRRPMQTTGALSKIPGSLVASFRILREFSPDIVVGVGGYASGPAVLAGRLMGIKTAVAEQNAFPGLTNRILGRFTDRIFLAFSASQRWFPKNRTMVTGNPIRADFLVERPGERKKGPLFTILIFGGSQGSHTINRIVGEALAGLLHLKDQLRFIHQTGESDRETVADAYRTRGFTAEVSPFIMNMAAAYREADLLLCRAGATSIAEITAGGKASILIPFPFAVNDHQTRNAETLSRAGAAEMIAEKDLNGSLLATLIERFYRNPEAIRNMGASAAKLGNPNAAKDIVDACLALLEYRRRTECI